MRCSKCGTESTSGRKFCPECGSPLSNPCTKCGVDNSPTAKFCEDCGDSLGTASAAPAKKSAETQIRMTDAPAPENLDGERKIVTALFADIKGSTELQQDLDPEQARAIIDPALKIMIDAARRYDGYVQNTGDGIFAGSVRPRRTRIIRSGRFTRRSECRRRFAVTATDFSKAEEYRLKFVWA